MTPATEAPDPRPMQGIKRQHSFSREDDDGTRDVPDKRMKLDTATTTVPMPPATRSQAVATWLDSVTSGSGDEYTPDPNQQANVQRITSQHQHSSGQGASASPVTPYRTSKEQQNFARHHTPSSWFPTPRTGVGHMPERQSEKDVVVHDPADHPQYREVNLRAHNIYLQGAGEALPEDVANLVYQVRHSPSSNNGTSSLDPTTSEIEADKVLQSLSLGQTTKPIVARILTQRILPRRHPFEVYSRTFGTPFAKWAPYDPGESPTSADLRLLAIPLGASAPDVLYGYDLQSSFSPNQRGFLQAMDLESDLQVPFLLVECVGDQYGPDGGGSMYTATNRCLRNAAACVEIADNLSAEVSQYDDGAHWTGIDRQVFSLATNGTEARLYVSWRPENELAVVTAVVKCFLLQDAQHYLELRRTMRGIIDWGKGRRLEQLRYALNFMSQRTGYGRDKSEEMDSLM